MSLEDMSPELQEKVKACKSKEELAELAKAMGVQLSEDELSAVAGGDSADACSGDMSCTDFKSPIPCLNKAGCLTFNACKLYGYCVTKNFPTPEECPSLSS